MAPQGQKQVQKGKPKTKAVATRRRKKKWFGIVAPASFKSKRIGETLANEPQELVGRSLRVSLMNILDDYRRQGVVIHFKVTSVNDDNGQCETTGYEIIRSHARRLVRKNTDKMMDSFVAKAKDGSSFRIKPVVVTRHRVSDAVVTSIRKKAAAYLSERIKELTPTEVFDAIIQTSLQKDLKKSLLSICPIGACDIRKLELVQ